MQNFETSLVDLSVPVDPSFWEPTKTKRIVINHKDGADLLGLAPIQSKRGWHKAKAWFKHYMLGKKVDHRHFPNKKGLSLMHYHLSTHTGTHMDAPYHYGDVDNQGVAAKTISDIPLAWCYGNGVLIDVSKNEMNSSLVSRDEVMAALNIMNYKIAPNDIVLIYTGSDSSIGTPQYFSQYRGISKDAVQYLVECGVKVIGIDSFSFDAPFNEMIEQYLKTQDAQHLWPTHLYGREREYCQLERLTNLQALKNVKNFIISCFPIKLTHADAAWCRVVAIINQ